MDRTLISSGGVRIVIISPEGYVHSACFREVAILLHAALSGLGFNAELAMNELSVARVNILLGYHLISPDFIEKYLNNSRYYYIPYQLEQLSEGAFPLNPVQRQVLAQADEIWDYSLKNIDYMNGIGLNACYLPIGYHKKLELINQCEESEKDIDILFYGSVGDRRRKLLQSFGKSVNLKVLFGVYGEPRDRMIARSKIVLNIHHYPAQLLETVRLSYLLNNRVFIVSESSSENPYHELDVVFSSYDALVASCQTYLSDPDLRNQLRKKAYIQFKKNFSMEKFLLKYVKE